MKDILLDYLLTLVQIVAMGLILALLRHNGFSDTDLMLGLLMLIAVKV